MHYQLYWNGIPSGFIASSLDKAMQLLGEIVGVNGLRDLTPIRYADGSYSIHCNNTDDVLQWTIQEQTD